ncbi:serine hydrolase domain-containing protein [Paenibacillus xanthanilyticus]|uniref:Serine hydrolase domain-containing protein n=1 Tax=Paenibacillus xanthanilyticus TaxID=1783531 RepID=A0ABV8JUI8_9BACL
MKEKRKKGRVWKIIGLLLGAAALTLGVLMYVHVDFTNPRDLDRFVEAKMNKSGITGASIALIEDNKLARIIHYGMADAEKDKPVTDETMFQIASVSKTVTATAVMQLAEKGSIGLDDDINEYLPFRVAHPKFTDTPITFRMLLTHTSSIDNNWDVYDSLYTLHDGGGDSPLSLETFLSGFLVSGGKWYDEEKNFTNKQPGTTFAYSNIGYGLLGYLVEEISGMPFPAYTQQHIFDPLGMTSTKWLHADLTDPTRLAIPYEAKNKPITPYSFPTYPDGALKTTAADFAKFYLAIMNGGRGEHGSILTASSIAEMFKPQADEGNQALGWSYDVLNSLYLDGVAKGTTLGHSGSDPGVTTITAFNPDTKSGFIAFFNQELDLNLRALNLHALMKRLVAETGM